jgi:hypothetical protein
MAQSICVGDRIRVTLEGRVKDADDVNLCVVSDSGRQWWLPHGTYEHTKLEVLEPEYADQTVVVDASGQFFRYSEMNKGFNDFYGHWYSAKVLDKPIKVVGVEGSTPA